MQSSHIYVEMEFSYSAQEIVAKGYASFRLYSVDMLAVLYKERTILLLSQNRVVTIIGTTDEMDEMTACIRGMQFL